MYRKLKRCHSYGNANYIPRFLKIFPELSRIDSDELCNRFRKLKLDFYYEEEKPIKWHIRITMPFAIILMILMLLFTPFKFILTGKWSYSLGKKNKILNWFKSLKLQ